MNNLAIFARGTSGDACAGAIFELEARAQSIGGAGSAGQSAARIPSRRGARVVDWDGLENRCARKGTVGSNPTLSAIYPLVLGWFPWGGFMRGPQQLPVAML